MRQSRSPRADAPSTPATVKVRAEGVNVHYGDKHALKDVNIDIPEKGVMAFIGPSGCGKTTFLRCLNRMNDVIPIAKVTGRILIDGQDINDRKLDVVELRARVGMVFQKPNPFPKSIFENVAYGPRIHGLAKSKAELEEIVISSLRRAGLYEEVKDRINDPGTGLSGGQQQRLCIARAIAVEPEIILMDEPCSALDPIATARIEELIDELKAHYTIVIVTHNMQQAARVSQRTAFFHLGSLVEEAPTRGDLQQPQRPAHAGLHHGAVRVSILSRLMARRAAKDDDGGTASAMTQTAPPAAPQAATAGQPHTVSSFDDDLKALGTMVADMGARAGRALAEATRALTERNVQQAQQVIASDRGLDLLQHEIEAKAVTTLARRQPMAVDLREIVSTMRIAGDLERIGDLAKNVAKRVIAIGDQPAPANLATGLGTLSERVGRQLSAVLKAYADRDDAAALTVWRADGAIDGLFTSLFRELLDLHDGGPALDRLLHAPPVLRQEPGASRRPRHQHRRDRALRDHRRSSDRRAPQGRGVGRHRAEFASPANLTELQRKCHPV